MSKKSYVRGSSDVSHTVLNPGVNHPLQGTFAQLIRSRKDLVDIWQRVYAEGRREGRTVPCLPRADVIEFARKSGLRDKLKAIVQKAVDGEDAARKDLPLLKFRPPPADELYMRVDAKTDIVDVGAGVEGKRIKRYSGYFEKVKVTDVVKVKELPLNYAQVMEIPDGEVVTSFNSYTQLDVATRVVVDSNDGVHVCPIIESFAVAGYHENGKTLLGGRVYQEFGAFQGGQVFGKYEGFNTYKNRELSLRPGWRVKSDGFVNQQIRPTSRVVYSDVTPKYDGQLIRLVARKGQFALYDRNGVGVGGKYPDLGPEMVLDLEKMKDCFRLLRVVKFRTFRPFHSVGMLQRFVDRVKIDISGRKVLSPEIIEPSEWSSYEADGFVLRYNGLDYVLNTGVHLDICHSQKSELESYLRDVRGHKKVNWSGSWVGDRVMLVVIREVNDKATCDVEIRRVRQDKERSDGVQKWKHRFKVLTVERWLEYHRDFGEMEMGSDSDGDSDDD